MVITFFYLILYFVDGIYWDDSKTKRELRVVVGKAVVGVVGVVDVIGVAVVVGSFTQHFKATLWTCLKGRHDPQIPLSSSDGFSMQT